MTFNNIPVLGGGAIIDYDILNALDQNDQWLYTHIPHVAFTQDNAPPEYINTSASNMTYSMMVQGGTFLGGNMTGVSPQLSVKFQHAHTGATLPVVTATCQVGVTNTTHAGLVSIMDVTSTGFKCQVFIVGPNAATTTWSNPRIHWQALTITGVP
jgi:hypothetical protein